MARMVESIARLRAVAGVGQARLFQTRFLEARPDQARLRRDRGRKGLVSPAPALAAMLFVASTLTGCGNFFAKITTTTSPTTPTTTDDYLYVANSSTALDTLAGYSLASGELTAVASSPYLVGAVPSVLAITPSNSFVFVGSEFGGIYAYAIGSTGGLTIGSTGLVSSVSATSLAVDSTGNWLLALQSAGTAPLLTVFAIDTSTGALTTQGSVSLDPGASGSLLFVPGTSLVYATLGTGGVDALTFDSSTGAITKLSVLLSPTRSGYSDQHLASNPAGTFLFVTETGILGVRSFSINSSTGVLTELAGSPNSTGLGTGAVAVDSTGSFVYVANSAANTISAFSLSTAGALTAISGSPFATGSSPYAMVEDKSKGYLAVTCSGGTPDLELFPIASSGALGTPITQATGTTSPAGATAIVASN